MKAFVLVARLGFVVALVPFGVICLVSTRALMIAGESRCAGHEAIRGYSTEDFFLFLCLIGAVYLTMVGLMAWGKGGLLRKFFANPASPPLKLGTIQFTRDLASAYVWLVATLLGLCFLAEVAVRRYEPISDDCQKPAVTKVSRLKSLRQPADPSGMTASCGSEQKMEVRV